MTFELRGILERLGLDLVMVGGGNGYWSGFEYFEQRSAFSGIKQKADGDGE